jgi:hypothetical protein
MDKEDHKLKFYYVVKPLDGDTEYRPENILYYKSTFENLRTYFKETCGEYGEKFEIKEFNVQCIDWKDIHNIKVKKKNEERKYQKFLKKEKEERKVNRLKDIEASIKQLELERQSLS